MMQDLRVSVITPVYNAAGRVQRSVESAVALPEVGEVILVEDRSPDGALEICRALAAQHGKVRLFQHPDGGNHGAGASRNLGVAQARFPFIAFLDADDWYLPHRFHAEARLLTMHSALDGVYNAVGHRYENEALRAQWLAQGRPELTTLSEPVPPEELIYVLLWAHPRSTGEFHTNGITVRRDFLGRIGGFHTGLRLQQDTHYWKRMAAGGRLAAGNLTEAVAVHAVHPFNRMTRVADHEQYMELWWSSLRECFLDMNVSPSVWQAYRRGYASFRAERRPRRRALLALANWALRQPSVMAKPYGHFDFTLRRILGDNRTLLHALSFKNRLSSRFAHTPQRLT
jgi:glycosyltransferase involved in cell wall biosynthesis